MDKELRANLVNKLSACGGLIEHGKRMVRRRSIVECLEDLDRAYSEVNACLRLLAVSEIGKADKQ